MAPTLGLGPGSSKLGSHMLRNSFYTHGRWTNCYSPSASRHMFLASTRSRCLSRPSVSSIRTFASNSGKRPRFSQRLGEAMRNTKIQWYRIPVGLGIGFLGLVQFYKVSSREKERLENEDGQEGSKAPKKRPRIRPDGPWLSLDFGDDLMNLLFLTIFEFLVSSFILGSLVSSLYPQLNARDPFANDSSLDEVAEPDLHVYPNLASFFYRTLKPGARPLDQDPHTLICPSDGKVLQFGQIQGNDIEQVKGMTYTIDALLGKNTPAPSISGASGTSTPATSQGDVSEEESLVKQHEEFAQVNGISYSLPDLLTGTGKQAPSAKDESMPASPGTVSEVRAELALGERPWYDLISPDNTTSLYYAVIYLAPGDYHRFHSPTNWVVDRRRHFAGELYSVSPYLQRTLPGLFTLNERVVLLGRWRWGFFSYVPVGATNVGSIVINFDKELRTNSLLTDTAADRAAEEAARRGEVYHGFAEATYEAASPVLRGHALRRGEEMGGFQLGSTIVLVFEAPSSKTDENNRHVGWDWAVQKGQKVKMGQALGRVIE
ncbi:phosphatidylserine decarboxylase [Fusarium bulbicola]|uniref:Phosphatidylserine decarboxylase proenzyme 1, mitochondrial n=1 Tax=Fusarium circinatum TaxID=48490 RepID=A0A8H5X4D1_FUSCI|nr:phosphatidylserine decarboxylase [Fusarium circinatum]KAF5963557.1 phosphatidylserine decarboxylase [Fusarium bulbicola]